MQEIDTLYNRYWEPIFRLLSDYRIVWFDWNNYWFLVNDILYNYSWNQVWWYYLWLVRDLNWMIVWFWENVTATIKPLLPLKHLKPLPYLVKLPPLRPLTSLPYLKPLNYSYWSDIELSNIFNQ